jgi:hypothetical protein
MSVVSPGSETRTNTDEIVVLHLSEEHLPVLRKAGMSILQWRSWSRAAVHEDGFQELAFGLTAGTDDVGVRHIEVPAVGSFGDDYVEYFAAIFRWALEQLQVPVVSDAPMRFVVNLMAFGIPRSVADKIIWGLRSALNDLELNYWPVEVTFLTQLCQTFSKSAVYLETLDDPRYQEITFSLVDYRGRKYRGPELLADAVPRAVFGNVLACDDREFYKKLIFETNSYIGHFVLPNAHARTHYDLNDLVSQNAALEYLALGIERLLADYVSVFVVTQGLEVVALEKLVVHLERHCPAIVGHAMFGPEIDQWSDDLKSAEAVLVLTDIVLTGGTLQEAFRAVSGIRGDARDVVCHAIAAMRNSPSGESPVPYSEAARIRRDFFPSSAPCLLCEVGQPKTVVSSAHDFKVVHPEQLTPLDFWEMVKDCEALRRREPEATGRSLTYRVETKRMVRRYQSWLKNVVREKYKAYLETEVAITRVLTVNEETGLVFAGLVCDALGLDREALVAVDRQVLALMMLPNVRPEAARSLEGERVLLADDGINEGHTLRMLAAYCQKQVGDLAGAIVFDNRLDPAGTQSLRVALGRAHIVSLYHWAASVIHCEIGDT